MKQRIFVSRKQLSARECGWWYSTPEGEYQYALDISPSKPRFWVAEGEQDNMWSVQDSHREYISVATFHGLRGSRKMAHYYADELNKSYENGEL